MESFVIGVACGLAAVLVLAFGLGVALGRHLAAPPRISYYGRGQQTGADLRRRLFGGDA